jgi:hypothetical protein
LLAKSAERRPYHAPELTEIGSVAEVTHAGGGSYTSDTGTYGS